MGLVELTSPTELAINLAELKSHLRVTSASEDALLRTYVLAATQVVESRTRRRFISRSMLHTLDEFPSCDHIALPVAPLVSVASVEYVDTAGTLTTWGSSNYIVDDKSILGRVSRAHGIVWPVTQSGRVNAVQVTFTAGYGATYNSVPPGIQMVIFYLASHFFTNRVPVEVGGSVNQVPMTFDMTMDPYKIMSV